MPIIIAGPGEPGYVDTVIYPPPRPSDLGPPLPPSRPTDLASDQPPAPTTPATQSASVSNGERQWIRACSLIVEDDSGNGLELSELRVRFRVQQKTISTPGNADILITNLSDPTANKIKKEFTKVQLMAGYAGKLGLLFQGEMIQKRIGRENPTDKYLDLIAVHSDKAYNFGTVSTSLAAGHTARDKVDAVLKALKPFGISAGKIIDLGPQKSPRGAVLHGMARDILRDIAKATGTSWSFQGNKLQMVPPEGGAGGDVVVLNSRSGMIGLPTQEIDGIHVRCLLRTGLIPGVSIVKIDQASIQEQAFSVDRAFDSSVVTPKNAIIPPTATDGLYNVLFIEHNGDTRGGPWYTDLICKSRSADTPIAFIASGRSVGAAENNPTIDDEVKKFSNPAPSTT